jgi:uncharacterized protein YutE (UPF0331/DUF86 family)
MDSENKKLLREHLALLGAASQVLKDSYARVKIILDTQIESLSVEQKESCEALTARFARLCDLLFQRSFRTLDRLELLDEGTGIDRLNRMEKRGIISSAHLWRDIRELRNAIVHDYLIEKSDVVLLDSFKHTPELLQTAKRFKSYCLQQLK